MDLRALEHERAFALLGPGFSGSGPLLITDLEPAIDGPLVFAPFETAGREARRFAGHVQRLGDFPAGSAPRPLAVTLDAASHGDAVSAIREAIAAGDVYQVCLTVRAQVLADSGAELLAALCRRGVPRFAAWVRFPDGTELVSGSPELLFEIDGDRIRSEPMKGTVRGDRADALGTSEKDQAELAMITDLVRNDLTPLCAPRSVKVVSARRFVRLPYAVQTVSDVEGQLLAGVGAIEALEAMHPGGSVTGAPKRAALAMLRLLEQGPRGAYCGALGYVEGPRATFALLIRAAEKHGGRWDYGVGSGIVYESDPVQELEELRVKLGAVGVRHEEGGAPPLYTTLRVSERGVVLQAFHRERLAGAGEVARAQFEEFARAAEPGVYALRASSAGLLAERRRGSALFDGMPVRFAVSPFAHERGALPKPAPPSAYDSVRLAGTATLLTSADGQELFEACSASLIGWDGHGYVCAPADRPRVLSTSEAAVRRSLRATERPLWRSEALPLVLLNAVKGPCRIQLPGRPEFPSPQYGELTALIESTARRA